MKLFAYLILTYFDQNDPKIIYTRYDLDVCGWRGGGVEESKWTELDNGGGGIKKVVEGF